MDQATETKLIQEAGAEMRRRGVPITPQKVAHFVAARTPPSVAEIDAALAGTGCVAVLNDLTGAVRVVKPPVLYTNLLPDELTALKKEKKDLEAILANPATPVIDRMRAQSRLSAVTVLIDRHEAGARRNRVDELGM